MTMPGGVLSFDKGALVEPVRRQVVITAVNVQTMRAAGRAYPDNADLYINLSAPIGPMLVIPSVGERWFVARVSNEWVLDRRTLWQMPTDSLAAGSQHWINPRGKTTIRDNRGEFVPVPSGRTMVTLGPGETLPVTTGDNAYQTPTLVNSWANNGGGFAPATFWKNPSGEVHIEGVVIGGSAGSVIFTLPVGFRPLLGSQIFAVQSGTAGQGRITIAATTGTVTATSLSAAGVFISLCGLVFAGG